MILIKLNTSISRLFFLTAVALILLNCSGSNTTYSEQSKAENEKLAARISELQDKTAENASKNPADYIELAGYYDKGTGVEKNPAMALKYYRQAGDMNDTLSQYKAAKIMMSGELGYYDYTNAAVYFDKAARNGHSPSMNNLGWLYDKGLGVKQSKAKAYFFYNAAAERNNLYGYFNRGTMLAEVGDRQSYLKAYEDLMRVKASSEWPEKQYLWSKTNSVLNQIKPKILKADQLLVEKRVTQWHTENVKAISAERKLTSPDTNPDQAVRDYYLRMDLGAPLNVVE